MEGFNITARKIISTPKKEEDLSDKKRLTRKIVVSQPKVKVDISSVLNKYKDLDKSKLNLYRTRDILIYLLNSAYLAFDTETTGLKWYANELVCLTFSNDGKKGFYIPWNHISNNEENQELLLAVFYSAEHLIGANIKFDLHYMERNLKGFFAKNLQGVEDIGQMSHAINSNRVKGLKPLTLLYTPYGGYDDALDEYKKQTKIKHYGQIPNKILSEYATIDAIMTYRLYFDLRQHFLEVDSKFPTEKPLKEWSMEKWYNDVMRPAYLKFYNMEHFGMQLDKQYMDEVRQKLQARIPVVEQKLRSLWNVDNNFKFNSPTQLGKQIEKMGWPKVEQAKSGLYATNDNCIQEWQRQNMPGIKELVELRELNSFLGTFIGTEGETDKDETGWEQFITFHPEDNSWRIHQSYIVMGTETYRCIGREPNLQNIPVHSKLSNEIKRCLTVPTAVHYTLTDEQGNVYEGGRLDTIEVQGKGRVTLDKVTEEDTIIPNSFLKYNFKYKELFKTNDPNWNEIRESFYIHK